MTEFFRRLVAFVFLFWTTLAAAQDMTFPSGDLNRKTESLIGDSAAWPVVYQLAEFNALSNTLTLKPGQIARLRQFRDLHQKVRKAKDSRAGLIKNGAGLFAEPELAELNETVQSYDQAVVSGNLDAATALAGSVEKGLEKTRIALEKNRVQSVSARLEEKIGSVFQRHGLLGTWDEAARGSFFEENDGIKTLKASQANLLFKDGSEVVVEEQTIATVRSARIDRLNQQVKTEVMLVNGSLLAKLSENAKQNKGFNLNMGTATSDLRTSKFWANKGSDKKIQMSNYDGEATLTSSNVSVTLKKNQGTVVVEGKAPDLPVDLLPSPKMFWPRQDSIIFSKSMIFRWTPVKGSKAYQVELARDQDFKMIISRQRVTTTTLSADLPLDEAVFVRIQAFDSRDLRGGDSPVYRVIRNDDKIPPAVFLDGIAGEQLFIPDADYSVSGRTEAFAQLTANDQPVQVRQDGSFSLTGSLQGMNYYFRLKVTDRAGNSRERKLTVSRMDTTRLAKVSWNVPESDRILTTGSTTVSVSGKAYPGMKISLVQGSSQSYAETSPDGDWALRFQPEGKSPVSLKFLTATGRLVHELRYQVK
ncbi:MAG: FecR domain-containing protein [Bacteroidetes bacterium]|nr:FecR domain-containing protein [Bacteroidota bacterium]